MSKTKIGCTYNDSTVFEIIVNPTESELKLRPKVCKKNITIGEREEISRNNNKMT